MAQPKIKRLSTARVIDLCGPDGEYSLVFHHYPSSLSGSVKICPDGEPFDPIGYITIDQWVALKRAFGDRLQEYTHGWGFEVYAVDVGLRA